MENCDNSSTTAALALFSTIWGKCDMDDLDLIPVKAVIMFTGISFRGDEGTRFRLSSSLTFSFFLGGGLSLTLTSFFVTFFFAIFFGDGLGGGEVESSLDSDSSSAGAEDTWLRIRPDDLLPVPEDDDGAARGGVTFGNGLRFPGMVMFVESRGRSAIGRSSESMRQKKQIRYTRRSQESGEVL